MNWPGDTNPCEIKMIRKPFKPKTGELLNRAYVANPICATLEYAINLLTSLCLNVKRPPYMIDIKLSVWSKGEKYNQPVGNSGKLILKNPYPPNFNSIPANKMDPDKGASTCAWGSHIWNGTTGILTRKPREKPKNNHFCKPASNFIYCR